MRERILITTLGLALAIGAIATSPGIRSTALADPPPSPGPTTSAAVSPMPTGTGYAPR